MVNCGCEFYTLLDLTKHLTLVLHLVSIWSQSLSHDLSHQKYNSLKLKIRGVIITREYL
jgi:hypothetical protein